MRDQSGFTVMELLAVSVLTLLLSGIAYLSGVNYAVSARTSKVASGVANSISVARALAITKSQPTRLKFVTDSSGMTHSYTLESYVYQACVPKWDNNCLGIWVRQQSFEQKESDPATGSDQLPRGAAIRFPGRSGEVTITFDPSGRRTGADNTAIELNVCSILKSGATETCHPGHLRRLCINKGGGLIRLLKEGETCQ